MLGLTLENVTIIRRCGYRIIEDDLETKTTIINLKGEIIAEISVNEKGVLKMIIGERKLEELESIYVEGILFSRVLWIHAHDFKENC